MLASRGLNFKIRFGFGIIVFLTALVGGLGWVGVEKLNRQLTAFSEWVEIDTVMHSTITANIAGLKYDIEIYTDSPSKDRFDALIESQEQIRKNIKNWHNRFAGKAEIREMIVLAYRDLRRQFGAKTPSRPPGRPEPTSVLIVACFHSEKKTPSSSTVARSISTTSSKKSITIELSR